MQQLSKKGVSPLIATVLLIGSTVVIASLLIMWLTGTVKETAEKEGVTSVGKQRCATEVQIGVTSCIGSAITITNRGSLPITAFRFKVVKGEHEGQVLTREDEVRPAQQKILRPSTLGAFDDIQVIPVIVVEGVPVTCSEQLVEVKCRGG